MTLRGKVVALVVGLTAAILAGLGLYLASSWSGWSREAVERDLSRRISAIAALVEVKKDGRLELEDEGSPLLEDPAHPFRIIGPSFSASNGELGHAWPDPEESIVVTQDGRGRTWTVMTRFVTPQGKHANRLGGSVRLAVQVAGMEAPFGALEERFRRGLLVALAAALVLGGGGAALLAHVAFAPLRRLASEADSIGATSLDRRIGNERLDPELRRVASSFNALLARLEEAMQRQRAFVSRASHALRTPTATILTRAEVALRRERTPGEYRAALDEIAGAARESAALVAHLLTLARLDDRRRALQLEDVAVLPTVTELSRLLGPRLEEAGLTLQCDVAGELTVRADRVAWRELLEALLDNAIRYTPRGGRLGVRASKDGAVVLLVVWDTGPGIPPAERGLVFERFHRGSAAVASGAPGSGLGLAIVRTIAEAHGATVSLTDHPGGGLDVTIRMT